jgi:fructose-bisphosphate aldolase class II
MKVPYHEIGVVNTKEVFKKAMEGGYAVPAYNFNNMEQLQAIIMGCAESRSPVILQVSRAGLRKPDLPSLHGDGRGQMAREMGARSRSRCTLTTGTPSTCKSCISRLLLGDDRQLRTCRTRRTSSSRKQVVDYANQCDVSAEGELGVLAGIEDDVSAEKSHYTDPKQVQDFVGRTGVHSLAISIGTSHGAYKFKLKPGETVPPLRFDILKEIEKKLPGFPIVLHGASSVLQKYVAMINEYGGSRGSRRAGTAPRCGARRSADQHRHRRPDGGHRHHPQGLRGEPKSSTRAIPRPGRKELMGSSSTRTRTCWGRREVLGAAMAVSFQPSAGTVPVHSGHAPFCCRRVGLALLV